MNGGTVRFYGWRSAKSPTRTDATTILPNDTLYAERSHEAAHAVDSRLHGFAMLQVSCSTTDADATPDLVALFSSTWFHRTI